MKIEFSINLDANVKHSVVLNAVILECFLLTVEKNTSTRKQIQKEIVAMPRYWCK